MLLFIIIILIIHLFLKKNIENFDKNNIRFIHIGKTGGTYIRSVLKLKQYHLKNNYKLNNEIYIIWLRNPIKRFVSAFYFSYSNINFNIYKYNNISLNNCSNPFWVNKKKINNNYYLFNYRYDKLINFFKTPNFLAESLTSNNKYIKSLAYELMNNNIEHIYKGIGWYLWNGDFVKKHYNKIFFVGSQENMDNDIKYLADKLNIKINNTDKIRENTNNYDKYLSKTAIQNIYNFYKDTDYKALKALLDYKFITKELYDSYFSYKINI